MEMRIIKIMKIKSNENKHLLGDNQLDNFLQALFDLQALQPLLVVHFDK